jgi:hypothetical protein
MFDPRKHNYFEKLIKLVEEGKVIPGLSEVAVYHDDWCAVYRGGYCDCDPEVKIWPPQQN